MSNSATPSVIERMFSELQDLKREHADLQQLADRSPETETRIKEISQRMELTEDALLGLPAVNTCDLAIKARMAAVAWRREEFHDAFAQYLNEAQAFFETASGTARAA